MTGILALLLGSGAARYTIIQTFTETQNWTCPTGVTQVDYLIVAGGGGGSAAGNSGVTGSGGGAGGFRTGTGLSVTAGTNYTITVGGGGAAKNDAGATAGNPGFDSSIAGSPITENPSGAGANTFKSYGGGGGGAGGGAGGGGAGGGDQRAGGGGGGAASG